MPEAVQGADPAQAETNPTPATAPEGAQSGDGGAAPAPAAADPSVTPKPDGLQRRIDELTRARYEAERRAEYWERTANQPPPKHEPAPTQAAKTLADFEYDEAKYQDYLFERATQKAVEAAEKRLKEQQERDTALRRQGEFQGREAKFAESVKDYHETVYSESVRISQAMAEVIAESEDGPALAYHLGKNPQIAVQISRLSPMAAARELGRIEAKLAFEKDKAKAATPTVSQAPPPTPKIEGGGDAAPKVSTTDPESDKLSDDEWVKAERARLARKAKRQANA